MIVLWPPNGHIHGNNFMNGNHTFATIQNFLEYGNEVTGCGSGRKSGL
jgi:hypothetical protein